MYIFTTLFLLAITSFLSRKNPNYRVFLIIVNTLISLIYIIWRISAIPIDIGLVSFILGVSLYLAELLGLIAFFNFQYLFAKKYKLKLKTLDDFKIENIPSIDVLICTYNEPLRLLEKTIAATTNLKYPEDKLKIYVCDDGKRDNLKLLCSKYKVNYLTREDNEGAKAGNINNALKHISGDLFAVLDADMIPREEFLEKTVGYFSDENMAFVQTPQVYYNQDMYQYNLDKYIPNEQDFFMRDIQEARASRGAVLHVGTNAVFRKKYVDEIGGYPTCSITEDMAIGMLLQEKGYNSALVNEELVLGLSANTFTELVKQRDRWCRGNLQALKHINPLFSKGLNLGQKIAYFDGSVYWFSNLQKMIYIICPLVYLLTSTLIINAPINKLLTIYIPFIAGQYFIFNAFSPKSRSIKWTHYYDIAMAPHLSLSILKELLNLNTKFNVTSKEVILDKKSFQARIVTSHIVLIVITIISWFISTKLMLNGNMHFGAYLINMVWSIFNFIGALLSIKVAYQKPIFRLSERIYIDDDFNVNLYDESNNIIKGKLFDISEKGVGIILNEEILDEYNLKTNDSIKLDLLSHSIDCRIVRLNNNMLGLKFKTLNFREMKLIMSIFTKYMKPYYDNKKIQNYIINNEEKINCA
ncbi:glycosyltransferase [Terrisporobacter sp.]